MSKSVLAIGLLAVAPLTLASQATRDPETGEIVDPGNAPESVTQSRDETTDPRANRRATTTEDRGFRFYGGGAGRTFVVVPKSKGHKIRGGQPIDDDTSQNQDQ